MDRFRYNWQRFRSNVWPLAIYKAFTGPPGQGNLACLEVPGGAGIRTHVGCYESYAMPMSSWRRLFLSRKPTRFIRFWLVLDFRFQAPLWIFKLPSLVPRWTNKPTSRCSGDHMNDRRVLPRGGGETTQLPPTVVNQWLMQRIELLREWGNGMTIESYYGSSKYVL